MLCIATMYVLNVNIYISIGIFHKSKHFSPVLVILFVNLF